MANCRKRRTWVWASGVCLAFLVLAGFALPAIPPNVSHKTQWFFCQACGARKMVTHVKHLGNGDPMASESRGHESKPADEIRLAYRIIVPDHVKGTITVGTKSIDMERVVDYREEYRSWHRFGWEGYRTRFVYVPPQSLFTDDLDLPFPQGTGHQLDAYNAGSDECAAAIKLLTDRYGEEAVRESFKRQWKAEKAKGNRG